MDRGQWLRQRNDLLGHPGPEFTSSLGASAWPTVTEFDYPTVAVLSDTSANVFGYAYELCDASDSVHDRIVVTSGTSEQDINSSAIVSVFASDPTVFTDFGSGYTINDVAVSY